MPRQVQIYLPSGEQYGDVHEKLSQYLHKNPNIVGLSKYVGEPDTLYIFRTHDKRVSAILEDIGVLGIGQQHGTVGSLRFSRCLSYETSRRGRSLLTPPNCTLRYCSVTRHIAGVGFVRKSKKVSCQ